MAPTINKVENTMMTYTKAQMTALDLACKAVGIEQAASASLAERAQAMLRVGFTSDMCDLKHENIGEFRKAVASVALSPEDYAVWADTSLARKVPCPSGEKGKRVNSARENLIKLVDQRIDRLGRALKEGVKTRGKAGNERRALKERITVEVGSLFKAVTKDATADAHQLDNKIRSELLAAFQRALDLVK